MASSAVSGKLMTLSVEGALLAESRSFSIGLNEGTIDVTNRDSDWWGEYLRGRRDWTIDFEGLYISSDLAKHYLLYYYSTRLPSTSLTVIITLADGTATLTGEALLTSLSFDGPFEDAAAVSGSLQGTSTLTANPVS